MRQLLTSYSLIARPDKALYPLTSVDVLLAGMRSSDYFENIMQALAVSFVDSYMYVCRNSTESRSVIDPR